MPSPIPGAPLQCSYRSLHADGGLRLFRTSSAFTLPFSRLARRSLIVLACALAGRVPSDLLHRRLRPRPLPATNAPVASGWNDSCRKGYPPPSGVARPFHGAHETHRDSTERRRLLSQLQASEHDAFAAYLYRSRKECRSVCQRAGKGGKPIERCVISTFQVAESMGFKGEFR
jgi:hypothetical protein